MEIGDIGRDNMGRGYTTLFIYRSSHRLKILYICSCTQQLNNEL